VAGLTLFLGVSAADAGVSVTDAAGALSEAPTEEPSSDSADPAKALLTPSGVLVGAAAQEADTGSGERCWIHSYRPRQENAWAVSPAVTDCSLSEPSVRTRAELHRHRWYG
jgi:hypothetical protein